MATTHRRAWTIGRVFVLRHAGMPFDWVARLGAPAGLLEAADAVLDGGEAAALDAYRARFEAADGEASAALRDVLAQPEVREAVFLSNPDVYRNMLLPYLAEPRPLSSRWRRARRQLYTYVLRFCAKNETVSFFGPMAYGTRRPGGGVTLRADLPPARRVFFAHWAARELARAVADDRRLRPHLPFRRTGFPAPDGGGRLLPLVKDGGASLVQVAREAGMPLRGAAEELRTLVAAGSLEHGIAPAADDADPLATMMEQLGRLEAPAAREWGERLAGLRRLVERLEVAGLAERVELLEMAEVAFTAATGLPARRGAGSIYADRAIVFEECSSPFGIEVGEDVLARWEAALEPLLEASCATGAAAQRAAAARVAGVLPAGTRWNLLEYGERLRPAFDVASSRFATDAAPTYLAECGPDVVEALAAEARRLGGDRYALVDLCPATPNAADLPAAHLILSRTHHHLLTDGWLATMFPDRAAFERDAREWTGRHPELVALDVGRRNKGWYRFPGARIALRTPSHSDAGDPGLRWPQQVTVEVGDAGVRCVDRDRGPICLYLPLSDFVKYPPYAALSHPQVVQPTFTGGPDVPPVTVGDVTCQRARWRLDPARLTAREPWARFLELRRLAVRTAPSRFVFGRTERERKPYLVDLESPLAADLAAHVARDGSDVIAEQMRPGPEELWLIDPEGRRYTCELRVQLIGRDREAGS